MSLQARIVGLLNVGKSTLFNALTAAGAESANYPFCTIEPNKGIVPVPDPRLGRILKKIASQRVLPAVVEIVDIACLVRAWATSSWATSAPPTPSCTSCAASTTATSRMSRAR